MTVRGGDLKHTIANLTGIPAGRFKLISSGHSIQDNLTLEQQNVKVGSKHHVCLLHNMVFISIKHLAILINGFLKNQIETFSYFYTTISGVRVTFHDLRSVPTL